MPHTGRRAPRAGRHIDTFLGYLTTVLAPFSAPIFILTLPLDVLEQSSVDGLSSIQRPFGFTPDFLIPFLQSADIRMGNDLHDDPDRLILVTHTAHHHSPGSCRSPMPGIPDPYDQLHRCTDPSRPHNGGSLHIVPG